MIIDLFAGPGGWDQGLAMLGRRDVLGIEWDESACLTAEAAGHQRLRADVAVLDPRDYAPAEGLIASPPCQAWSMAGKRGGEADREHCHRLADRMAAGDDSTEWAEWEDPRSALVCQPVRWVRDICPEWIALEEVPAVASLWEHFARIFRAWGYSVWTGDLCAADYGVPQTRTRRILTASRVRPVTPPAPTHAEHPEGDDLFGGGNPAPWVSMAEALGWGFDSEPACTVSSGGTATGGAEPFANAGYRRRLAAFVSAGITGEGRPKDAAAQPADTITGKGTAYWTLRNRRDSPKWVAEHGERENRAADEPAPTFTGEAHRWVWDRPSTTVAGDPRIARPGHRDRAGGERQFDGGVRVTVQEAGVLQSFPADYPWQGTRTKQFGQVGDAVPPLLAAHILQSVGAGTFRQENVA